MVTAASIPPTPRLHTPRRRTRWRVVDIVVASVVAVACSVLFVAWDAVYEGPNQLLTPLLPGVQGLLNGPWLIAGVLGGLIVRKPGAAVYVELVAAVVEALIGNKWGGFPTLLSGAVQGLGAELVLAILLYRAFGPIAAMLAGAGAGLGESIVDLRLYYQAATPVFATTYGVTTIVSGAIFGIIAWALVRALAATGALNRFAAGRSARRLV